MIRNGELLTVNENTGKQLESVNPSRFVIGCFSMHSFAVGKLDLQNATILGSALRRIQCLPIALI